MHFECLKIIYFWREGACYWLIGKEGQLQMSIFTGGVTHEQPGEMTQASSV